jgi:hypothetical protein
VSRPALLLVVALALPGCAVTPAGDIGTAAAAQASSAPRELAQATPAEAAADAPDKPPAAPVDPATDAASTTPPDGSPPPATGTPAPAPTTPGSPSEGSFSATATVTPTCAGRGETIAIEIRTVPNAGVAYHAIYAGEEGGGPPPYGKGHGGNDGDLADAAGRYRDTWTVGPATPLGPARVDVVVGADGAFRELTVPFAVADPVTGRCGGTS